MQYLDLQVIERALEWARAGETLWLCTVLTTFGSSPREPGSLLVARRDGAYAGSLSGGCVEEDFLARLQAEEFVAPIMEVRYGGDGGPNNPQISLPCGGILEVLIERLEPGADTLVHLSALYAALLGQRPQLRRISLHDAKVALNADSGLGPRVERDTEAVRVRVGPASRLLIAGISPVSVACAEFARSLGFEVIVCDPRQELHDEIDVSGVRVETTLPSSFIAAGGCHGATAVVALTHDPRIDDLAMIEAVRTEAFYIGVMGSVRTSRARAERLRRSGGLSDEEVARLHMPIGLALGSKTPAEIALAVMADVLRVQRGRERHAL